MAFYKSVLIFTFVVIVKSKIEAPFSACNKEDLVCINTAKESVYSYNGDEKLDLVTIDPLIPPLLDIVDEAVGVAIHLNNTSVTGFKSLKINDFKIDTDKKSVVLQMKSDIAITGDADVEYTKLEKTFNGHYTASATVIGTSKYNYSIKEEDGTEYFELGEETNECEIVGEPKVTLKIQLNDSTDREQYAKLPELDKAALRQKTICQVVDTATATIIQNLRVAAKAFPKSAFFKDV